MLKSIQQYLIWKDRRSCMRGVKSNGCLSIFGWNGKVKRDKQSPDSDANQKFYRHLFIF